MKNPLFAIAIVLSTFCVSSVAQPKETVLYSFQGNPDGAQPLAKVLVDSHGNLFSTTPYGGNVESFPCFGSCGTVFELTPDGNGNWIEHVIYNFCQNFDGVICLDGETPLAALISDASGNLYGTTSSGGGENCPYGGGGCGTVFELSPPVVQGGAWSYALLYQFCQIPGDDGCSDGAGPSDKLLFDSGGNLYGTTSKGGLNSGVVFELSPSAGGWAQTVLYTFCSGGSEPICPDGARPVAGVAIDRSGNLYGTTAKGGSQNFVGGGVVYELTPGQNGWTETVLCTFPSGNGVNGGDLLGSVNFDSAGNLYSTAFSGGEHNLGVAFRLSSQNGGSRKTFSFSGLNGAQPAAGVLIDPRNGNLYGTTSSGGNSGYGALFRIAGKTESVIYSFAGSENGDGVAPMGALEFDHQGNLYGTTESGGQFNQGTVFEIVR